MLLYRLLWTLLALPVALALTVRVLHGRETCADLRERLGLAPGPAERRPTLWIHAASNGELASARPVIEALRESRGAYRLLVTTNTLTARAMARDRGLDARLAPLDLRWAGRRLVRLWSVEALISLEAELWPNRHRVMATEGRPVILLGARLGARTARTWTRLAGLARRMLAPVAFASPQNAGTAQALAALGLPDGRIGPVTNLKALYRPAALTPDPGLAARFRRGETWLAASTHEGEEEIVLAAHRAARQARPGLRLVMAPRHPRRGDEVARQVEAAGFAVDRRSAPQAPDAPVLLADTMGEMDRWYALAGVVLVGGSLVARGGHTPFEPMAHGCAILHGPHVANFAEAYAALDAAGGAREAATAEDLARALVELEPAAAREGMAAAAQAALSPEAGLDALLDRIAAVLGDGPAARR